MTTPNDPKISSTRDTCGALLSISEDFHQILRASCPRCTTGVGACGVQVLRSALAAEDARAIAPDAPAGAPEAIQVTRH